MSTHVIDETVTHGEPTDQTWLRFVDASARALDRQRAQCRQDTTGPTRRAMYEIAISLMGDAGPIRQELVAAGDRMAGEDREKIARGCVWSGLYRMRHRAAGDSEHSSKNWRRVDRISKAVFRDQVKKGVLREESRRYRKEHFEAVADYIRRVHLTDRNLPRTPEGVQDLFGKFSREMMVYEEYEDLADVTPEDIGLMDDAELQEMFLNDCVGELPDEHGGVIARELRRGPVVDLTAKAYAARVGISIDKYNRLFKAARELLGRCIEGKRAARAGSNAR